MISSATRVARLVMIPSHRVNFLYLQNGDLNWIVKDKILAFAGPSYERHVSPEGYCTLAPADYIPYFQKKNVTLVVRLNKKAYTEQDFVDAGIDHLEAFFLDGSCPPMKVLHEVLEAFERVPPGEAFAVHCKAGLGRTGTCIGAYLMKHYHFTAKEAIAWMRICRPGCVIGPQQHFLQQIEHRMWTEGDKHGPIDDAILDGGPMSPRRQLAKIEVDAVTGRAGQAESLLKARAHRPGGRPKDLKTVIPGPPMTPEQQEKEKIATVTPEGPKARLWFSS